MMINVTEKLETLEHESTLIVHETLKRKKQIIKYNGLTIKHY